MYCSNCGKEIDDKAVVCIHCGCATSNQINNTANQKSMTCAVILWLFLGGIGMHRFYLKDNTGGTLMLLCFLTTWLIIPGIILIIWWIIDIFKLVGGSLQPQDGSKLV